MKVVPFLTSVFVCCDFSEPKIVVEAEKPVVTQDKVEDNKTTEETTTTTEVPVTVSNDSVEQADDNKEEEEEDKKDDEEQKPVDEKHVPIRNSSNEVPISRNAFAKGSNMNSGNVKTDRPSSRVLAPPGGHCSIKLG